MKIRSSSVQASLVVALLLGAGVLACEKKKDEAQTPPEPAVTIASATESYKIVAPKLKELIDTSALVRKSWVAIPEDTPGREPLATKLFEIEEVIGVSDAEYRWLGGELEAAQKSGDANKVREVNERIKGNAKGIEASKAAMLDLAHKLAELQGMVKQVEDLRSAMQSYKRTLSTGFEVKAALGGLENQLIDFLEDPKKKIDQKIWFVFEHLLMLESGEGVDVSLSRVELQNVAEILKAFPKVKVKVGGYTDNQGIAAINTKVSKLRAESVQTALTGMGVAASRVTAEGFGADSPVCPANDSTACRNKNRRIALNVTAK